MFIDLHSVMDILKLKWTLKVIIVLEVIFIVLLILYKLDLIELKILITLVVVEMFAGVIAYLIGKKNRSEQKYIKETERQNEMSNLIQSLLAEININQKQLHPLSDCVIKVLDNNNHEYSEEERIPNNLRFERTVYSSLSDKIGLLDKGIITKLIQYYSKTKDIGEMYETFEFIHNESHSFLNYVIIDSEIKQHLGQFNYDTNHPGKIEIEGLFRQSKEVYNLGADLIISLEDNKGA